MIHDVHIAVTSKVFGNNDGNEKADLAANKSLLHQTQAATMEEA